MTRSATITGHAGLARRTARARGLVGRRSKRAAPILDCAPPAPLRRSLDEEWRAIPGVVATGLFFELAPTVLVERRNGRLKSVYDEPMSATAQTLVIGLGNDFRHDDGAGRIAARRIKAETGEDLRVMRKAVKARR